MDFKAYLTVLGSFLKRRSRLVRKRRHISSFEDLIVFLCLAELDVHLHSPAAKLLRSLETNQTHVYNCSSWMNVMYRCDAKRKLFRGNSHWRLCLCS